MTIDGGARLKISVPLRTRPDRRILITRNQARDTLLASADVGLYNEPAGAYLPSVLY